MKKIFFSIAILFATTASLSSCIAHRPPHDRGHHYQHDDHHDDDHHDDRYH